MHDVRAPGESVAPRPDAFDGDAEIVVRRLLTTPCLFALTWWGSVLLGWSALAVSAVVFFRETAPLLGASFVMIATLVILGELRPFVTSNLNNVPVPFSTAFVFAALYLWGLPSAVLLTAVGVAVSEVARHKPLWKLLFNVGQYVLSVCAGGLVLWLAGTLQSPGASEQVLDAHDIPILVFSWAAYHVVNLALVAGVAASDGETFAESFSEDFWFYTFSTLAVLAMSPLVAIVAAATPTSWLYLPLLVLPLLAVYVTARFSRDKEHQSLHDGLTGLPNRRLLEQRTEDALADAARAGGTVALCLLDLDRFKEVNDTLGHHAGDVLLRVVADRLTTVVRPADTVARLGGDEFAVLLPAVRAEQAALEIAERIADALAAPIELEGVTLQVSVSIGVATSSSLGRPGAGRAAPGGFEGLLRHADVAMYAAKEARGSIAVYRPASDRHSAARLGAAAALRRALDDDRITVSFQPKVSARDGSTVGMEALARWQDEDRGAVSPEEFVALADRTGQMRRLTGAVLTQALDAALEWRRLGLAIPVAVNVSMRDLQDPDFVGSVRAALAARALPPSALALEMTEHVFAEDVARPVTALRALAEFGVRSSLDDFGTGFSSLSLLEHLPVTEVKIDRSFVARLANGQDRGMVAAILAMAAGLELTVVAEGVEDEATFERLRRLGCDVVQGWYVAPAMPFDEATDWLLAHRSAPAATPLSS